MRSLDKFAAKKLAELEDRHLRRVMVETVREGIWVERNGRRILSFSCNDYLNLTRHPAVVESATRALHQYGVGSGASRLVTGNHPLFADLEGRLARLKGTESACVFGSGYLANTGIIPVLIGAGDLVLIDELAHSCMWAGAQLSKGKIVSFLHNDVDHARESLMRHRRDHCRTLIATDRVFSMDGDLAPLDGLAELAEQFDAWLMTDDAHGIGVLDQAKTDMKVPLQMGTLSKAIGSYGGYLCASGPVIELIRNRARTLIYSTGLPPSSVAAAIAAIDIIRREPDYAAQPVRKARAFTRRVGLPEAVSPIVPIVIGTETAALAASRLLEDEGFLVVAIRPPTVPKGTARLRLTFTALHPDDEIDRLADIIRKRILER